MVSSMIVLHLSFFFVHIADVLFISGVSPVEAFVT
jgi:hypothetical protein